MTPQLDRSCRGPAKATYVCTVYHRAALMCYTCARNDGWVHVLFIGCSLERMQLLLNQKRRLLNLDAWKCTLHTETIIVFIDINYITT